MKEKLQNRIRIQRLNHLLFVIVVFVVVFVVVVGMTRDCTKGFGHHGVEGMGLLKGLNGGGGIGGASQNVAQLTLSSVSDEKLAAVTHDDGFVLFVCCLVFVLLLLLQQNLVVVESFSYDAWASTPNTQKIKN